MGDLLRFNFSFFAGGAAGFQCGDCSKRGFVVCVAQALQQFQASTQQLTLFDRRTQRHGPRFHLFDDHEFGFGNGEAVAYKLGLFAGCLAVGVGHRGTSGESNGLTV